MAASFPSVAAFHLSFLLLVALTFPRPRLYVYSAFAVFLALGFWMKFALLAAFQHPLIEPVGSFSGLPAQWSSGLAFASVGAFGAASARLVHLFWARRSPRPRRERPGPPPWFRRRRAMTWAASVIGLVSVNAWNLHASVYQVGLDPRVVLPGPANVLICWILVLGAPLWVALLLEWELFNFRDGSGWLWVPMVEGVISSTSMLSRAVFLLRMLPYALASSENRGLDSSRGRRNAAFFSLVAVCLFAVSLTGVSLLRLAKYSAPVTPNSSVSVGGATIPRDGNSHAGADVAVAQRRFMLRQVIGLFTDRWVGLEGVLAVTSYRDIGSSLFLEALAEDPRRGSASIYQRVTGFTYGARPGVTFLTLPGIVAVLAYSGSLIAVFLGMAGITALAFATELFARRFVGSELVCAVAGTGLAFVLCQTNFPYLTGVFVLELWATFVVLAALQGQTRRAG